MTQCWYCDANWWSNLVTRGHRYFRLGHISSSELLTVVNWNLKWGSLIYSSKSVVALMSIGHPRWSPWLIFVLNIRSEGKTSTICKLLSVRGRDEHRYFDSYQLEIGIDNTERFIRLIARNNKTRVSWSLTKRI